MNPRFVTLFPIARNIHLIKDVGQVPCFMNRLHGYHSELVCYRNDEEYPYLNSEAKGLKIEFLESKGKRLFLENAAIEYLQENAANIDVLNLYHLDRDTFYYGNLYKKLNPNGFLYVKLDLSNKFLLEGKKKHSLNLFKNWILRRWEKKFIRNTDLFSVENRSGLELMKLRYPECDSKIIYLPNGINCDYVGERFDPPGEKEKIILVMARIGESVKNHEILLRIIPHLDLKKWKIVFAGPVVQRFKPKVEAFFHEFPEHRENVIFTGEITDRRQVYSWFRRSMITCLTSVDESFGLVLVEGLYFGNYLVGTEGMSSFDDITDSGRFGKKLPFNDDEALRTALQEIIDHPEKTEALRGEAHSFATEHFMWPVLVQQLEDEIQKRRVRS